jgi:adenylate cyclase
MGESPEQELHVTEDWRAFLMGEATPFHRTQRVFRHIPTSPRCRLCYAPFRGPGGVIMRVVGRAPAKMNPNICDVCERRGREHPGGAVVPLTMLFADIRGSTPLAEKLGTTQFPQLIARFYDAVTSELLKQNALIDRLIGDEAVALFVPILTGSKHAQSAVAAARGIMKATGHGEHGGPWVPVGIGVHTGTAFVGSVGSAGVNDVTALGDDVNLTARLASVAAAGEVVMTEATRAAVDLPTDGLEMRCLDLKGRSTPVDVWVMRTGVGVAK